MNRKPRSTRLKSQDLSQIDESSEIQTSKLYSKLNASDLKYSDLLSKVRKFSTDLQIILESWNLPQAESEKIQQDLYYFLNIPESPSPVQLFLKFKQELLERLNLRELNRDSLKSFVISGISEMKFSCSQSGKSKNNFLTVVEDKSEFTPVRLSRNSRRSTSPGEKSFCLVKENLELKSLLSEIGRERDLLKIWKENIIKHPNFEEDAQKIIKDLREESELNAVKSNCNFSKLAYIVNATNKFLNNTSKFQKIMRENYPSFNFYEDEKAKLEVKLREVMEIHNADWKPPPSSPLRTDGSERRFLKTPEPGTGIDVRKKSKELPIYYNEKINNRLIDEITKQYNDRVENLNSYVARLENDNRKLKNKYFVVKKEMKQVKTTENQKKVEIFENFFQKQSSHTKIYKKTFSINFSIFNKFFELILTHILNKLEEKENQLARIKTNLAKLSDKNLESLISLSQESEKNNTALINDYQIQIANLEQLTATIKTESDLKVAELEISLNESLNKNLKFEEQTKNLESKIAKLVQIHSINKDLEQKILIQNEKIADLELKTEKIAEIESKQVQLSNILQDYKETKSLCKRLELEREMVDQDNQNLNQELNEKALEAETKSKEIKSLKTNLKISEDLRKKQETEANKIIENLVLEKQNLIDLLTTIQTPKSSTLPHPDLDTSKLSTPTTQSSPQIPSQENPSKNRQFPSPPKLKSLSPEASESSKVSKVSKASKSSKSSKASESSKAPDPENHPDLQNSDQELINLKSQLFFAQSQTELVQLELAKVRENYRNFESFLKYRLRQMETGEIFMNRLDLNNYNNF